MEPIGKGSVDLGGRECESNRFLAKGRDVETARENSPCGITALMSIEEPYASTGRQVGRSTSQEQIGERFFQLDFRMSGMLSKRFQGWVRDRVEDEEKRYLGSSTMDTCAAVCLAADRVPSPWELGQDHCSGNPPPGV